MPHIIDIETAPQKAIRDLWTFSESIPIKVIVKIKIDIQKGENISM